MGAPAIIAINQENFSELGAEEFSYFQGLIAKLAGIHLTTNKQELVKTRLRPHIISLGFNSYKAYQDHLRRLRPTDPEFQQFINLLTTNKTDFFREPKHFQFLSQYLTEQRRGEKTSLWCCASSTGEEPYTLSMVMQKALAATSYEILATDIDTKVLQIASNGVYAKSKLADIPTIFQENAIEGRGDVHDWFKINNRTREAITFAQHNLMSEEIPEESPFDLIFCRNVLIYFTKENVQKLMQKLHGALKTNGLLFIGHSESISGTDHLFELIEPAIYRKL